MHVMDDSKLSRNEIQCSKIITGMGGGDCWKNIRIKCKYLQFTKSIGTSRGA